MYLSKLNNIFLQSAKCCLTIHRLGVQIKQTSIGVVQTNCFRFLAWRIVCASFSDVFYSKYAPSNLALPKYASRNWSFTAWKDSIVCCASQGKTNLKHKFVNWGLEDKNVLRSETKENFRIVKKCSDLRDFLGSFLDIFQTFLFSPFRFTCSVKSTSKGDLASVGLISAYGFLKILPMKVSWNT